MSLKMFARPLIAAVSLGVLAQAGAASAQTATAQAPLGGPVITGVCILSNDRLIRESAVGKAVIARMGVLAQEVQTELNPERTSLQNESTALQTAKAPQTDPRWAALGNKAQAFDRKAQVRSREMEATQQKALARIATEAEPVIRTLYTQRNCGVLFDRQAVFAANPAMDVTDAAVAALNAKIQTFTFARERMQQTPATAAAPTRK